MYPVWLKPQPAARMCVEGPVMLVHRYRAVWRQSAARLGKNASGMFQGDGNSKVC